MQKPTNPVTGEGNAPRRSINTPWGKSDNVEVIDLGHHGIITHVGTPSHGGYYVPKGYLWRIPEAQRRWAAKWSGSEQWYEEDCCWAAVALAFPAAFPEDAIEIAKTIVATYCKEVR